MNHLMLVKPTLAYADEIMAYRRECLACGSSMDGCGALRTCDTAEAYIESVEADLHPETLKPGRVTATQLVCVRVSDGKVVGMIQIRHYFNDFLRKYGGHVGYSVRPSQRRKGYAKAQLRMALPLCRELGLTKVLITCEPDNLGSEKTIVANGGVYECTVYCESEGISLKRYWIDLQER
ncbi:MAG: GNAT family N-acetyltransferase [Eubacteriales bacterium]